MDPKKSVNHKRGPEDIIQEAIISYLRVREWFVKSTHGNMYQSGFPDLCAWHHKYGQRWIEVKNPGHYQFTAAQLRDFPLICANGGEIWIMVAATDEEYAKLFKPFNWFMYLDVMKWNNG
jgi:hypothetical protein